MTKHVSLLAAVGVVLVANGFALMHAARNRMGEPDAEIVLTQRELSYFPGSDNTGVELHLIESNRGRYFFGSSASDPANNWMDESKLRSLGFDCRILPANPAAVDFYRRQRPRSVFLALEYDGPAFQRYLEQSRKSTTPEEAARRSHLVPIDAATDYTALRKLHADRRNVLVVPAVIGVALLYATRGDAVQPAHPDELTGFIVDMPRTIHVPLPWSGKFRAIPNPAKASYRVHLRYGRLLDPQVTGVDIN